MRTVAFLLLLMTAGSLVQAEEVDRPDQPGWVPEFTACPDTIVVEFRDSAFFDFEAINPNSHKPAHQITYSLLEGPGTIDSITGLWSYYPSRCCGARRFSHVTIGATIGSSRAGRDATCRFTVKVLLPDRAPTIVKTGTLCGDTVFSYRRVELRRFYCDTASYDFDACDPDGDPFVFELVSGPGVIDSITGVWTLPGATSYGLTDTVEAWVRARNQLAGQQVPVVVVTRHAPIFISQCPTDTIFLTAGREGKTGFGLSSPSTCINGAWSVLDDSIPSTTVSIDGGQLSFRSLSAGTFTETAIVTDGLYADTCAVTFVVQDAGDFGVAVEKVHNVIQGQTYDVAVSLTRAQSEYELGGFDILIAYDNSALSLQQLSAGELFDSCSWEYFTYRIGPFGGCPDGCPNGLVRAVGLAETNNGDNHPSCFIPPSLPMSLFTMKFLVSNDRTLECQWIPIRFFWIDCSDNAMMSRDGHQMFIVDQVLDYGIGGDTVVLQPPVALPSYAGVPIGACDLPVPFKPLAFPTIDFRHGGMDVACADSIDIRGDINLNGMGWEMADVVLFGRYFIYGTAVFSINLPGQIASSDINKDGTPLTLEDYFCLYQVVAGNYPTDGACSPPSANQAIFTIMNNTVFVATPDTIGVLFLRFQENVLPSLLTDKFTMDYNFDGTSTRVLLGPSLQIPPDSEAYVLAGQVLGLSASTQIVEAQAVTYRGSRLTTRLDVPANAGEDFAGSVPDRFALRQNYPNPFNAGTVISFDLPNAADVKLEVFNLLGQVVFLRRAHYAAGTHQILWGGTDDQGSSVSSGMYYYRLSAGDATMTRKMLLLK